MLGAILGVLKAITKGFVSGAIASLIGYAKIETKTNPFPKWNLSKLLQEVFLGGFTWALIYGSGMPISELSTTIAEWLEVAVVTGPMVEFLLMTILVIFVDHIVKIIVRRSDIMILWEKFKAFLSQYF